MPLTKPAEFGIGLLFHLIADAVIVADAHSGNVALWNSAATDLFGYTESEAIGMSLTRLVPEDLRDQHTLGLQRYAETGTAPLVHSGEIVELPALHRDGHTVWIELRLSALPSKEPDQAHVLAVIRNVTERRRHSEKLAKVNQSLRDFLAMASHDLKTPATAISLSAQTLLDDSSDPEQLKLLLEVIDRQSRWLARLIDDFDLVARVDAGVLSPKPVALDVAEVVREVAAAADVEVTGEPSSWALVDPTHLRRIVGNLIQNSVKHGSRPVSAAVERRDAGVVVSIADSGAGVPAEDRGKLFGKFWRGNPRVEGSGLGLAIVHGLVVANGGSVWYHQDDRPTFSVWLRPAAPAGRAAETNV